MNTPNQDEKIENEINNDLSESIIVQTGGSPKKGKKNNNKEIKNNNNTKDNSIKDDLKLTNNEEILEDHREMLLNYNTDCSLKIGRNKITKYELPNVIGKRATLLAYGAEPNIEVKPGMSVIDIAEAELNKGMLPLMIERTIGNKTGIWKLKDLIS
mgnify:CR=1 FL=1|tara:strand:- start:8870 stop:9337 length:468 start_codon:yes stop_codon:yes gene_type:complete